MNLKLSTLLAAAVFATAALVPSTSRADAERLLGSTRGPIVAATDYVRAVPESVRAFLPPGRAFATLGTDGFGRRDTRAALRRYFAVDAASILAQALTLSRTCGTGGCTGP